jgi:hypothetical protein
MMVMVSPAMEAYGESLSSLKFANRAKNIKNKPTINEDVGQKALLRKYEIELQKLRDQLKKTQLSSVNTHQLTRLQQEKLQAEQDKITAVTALEIRSREFFEEREKKR